MSYEINSKEIRKVDYWSGQFFWGSIFPIPFVIIGLLFVIIKDNSLDIAFAILPIFLLAFIMTLVFVLLYIRRIKMIKTCLSDGIETKATIEKYSFHKDKVGRLRGVKIKYFYETDGEKYFGSHSIARNGEFITNYREYKENIGSKIIILVNKNNYKNTVIKDMFVNWQK